MGVYRRAFLAGAGAAAFAVPCVARAQSPDEIELPLGNGTRPLAAFPQKRRLIVLTPRPPQLETPFSVFDESDVTPNDAFYVRWHLAGIPTSVDADAHRVRVHGSVNNELNLSLQDLKTKFERVTLTAVNQCSGNSRGLSSPRVPGGQWFNGAMGNARWTGARLMDILAKAGVGASAKQIRLRGLDGPVLPATPPFVKALSLDEYGDNPDILLAYEMNGAPLPLLNGYPVRLVVPGYYATYWMKMLSDVELIDVVDDNFWMKTAYRIPDTTDNTVAPTDTGYPTKPIGKLRVRSFVTSVASGGSLKAGPQTIRGIAFDSGSGIKGVQFSSDGGASWTDARLGDDLGTYSFRRWETNFAPDAGKSYVLACKATSNAGETQTTVPVWNPGGYLRNVIENYNVSVT